MRITWIYKNYKESITATLLGALGAIFAVFSLLILMLAFSKEEEAVVIGVLMFLVASGVCMMWYAPKYAKKDMERRIVKHLDYAKYVVQTYPQYIERVIELRPEGRDEVEQWQLESLPEKEVSKAKVLALLIVGIVVLVLIELSA